MTIHRREHGLIPSRSAWLIALLLVLPPAVEAQSAPATSSSTAPIAMPAMPGMDHDEMPGMDHPAVPIAPTAPDMPALEPPPMPGMPMAPMQGGRPPADARSGDYSDGIAASPMHAMPAHGRAASGLLRIDQLEAFHGDEGNGQRWEVRGWYGNDSDKLWLRSEGVRSGGKLEDGELELLWNHVTSSYWSRQLGVRHDIGNGPARSWIAVGVQGLAPYWFELEATAYAGAGGRTAARLRVDYELLLTQRLVLQPELEVNLYGRRDPQRRLGEGVSDIQFGLRLRYEIRREFAPYVGVNWTRRVGATADYARHDQRAVRERQWLAGVRFWF